MTSCLGIFIEPNIIKYAKISKDHDNLRVESFGIKFYDKIGEAINQIISDLECYIEDFKVKLENDDGNSFNVRSQIISVLNKQLQIREGFQVLSQIFKTFLFAQMKAEKLEAFMSQVLKIMF